MRASKQLRTQFKSDVCYCLPLDAIRTMASSDDDIQFISSNFPSERFLLSEYISGAGAGSSGAQGHNRAIAHAISSVTHMCEFDMCVAHTCSCVMIQSLLAHMYDSACASG